MRLRWRLALLFALATAALISIAGVVFVLQLRVSVDASLDPGLRARVAIVADEFGTEGGFPGQNSNDAIVQVVALNGKVLAATPAAGGRTLLDPAQRDLALAGEVSFTAAANGDRSRILATTAETDQGRVLVVVGAGTDVSDAAVDRAVSALVLGGPPAVVLAGIGAWLLAGAVLRPVERMRRTAADISDRDLDRRLAVPATRDEIAALGTTINALLGRLQSALSRERAFVADAGHELRTPLAILRTELELAARPGRSRDDLADAVALAGEETDRLIRLAEDLLLLARADNAQPFLRSVDVALPTLLKTAARGASTLAADRNVTVVATSPEELTVIADPDRLRQAVDNLIDNATRHAAEGSTIEVTTACPNPGIVAIRVADRGPGFPSDFLPHAFERFHRAENARTRHGGGTGLGLSIVRAIAEAHGGRAYANNRNGGGAVVTIEVPIETPTRDPLHHVGARPSTHADRPASNRPGLS